MSAEKLNEIAKELGYYHWEHFLEDHDTPEKLFEAGIEYAKQSKQEEVNYQKMFANCKLPKIDAIEAYAKYYATTLQDNGLRKAAEKFVEVGKMDKSLRTDKLRNALYELEKALNQKK